MNQARGFTLIELAIVLVIITFLIGGLAMPLSAQIQARRVAETRQTMEEAREAIIGFAMTHPTIAPGARYLPCPDTTGDGREDRLADACANIVGTTAFGLLPWVDLGVAPQDAWGNRLSYAVVAELADRGNGFSTTSSTPLTPLVVCKAHSCTSPDVADNVAFTIVSHGPNGWGAQNVNNIAGALQAAPSGADELANLDTDHIFVSRASTQAGVAAGEFDDLVGWISFPQLIPRVCPTSGCP